MLLPYEDGHLSNYHRAKTVDEAVALSAEVAPKDGCILAGVLNIVKSRRNAAAENRPAAR